MKQATKRLLTSFLSLALVLSMVLGMCPTVQATAQATSGVTDVNNDGKITYVSFGDSVTNGYGLPGYRYEDGTNVLGFRREVETAYPALIRNYLTELGYNVDLEQMAISGFRMDELHWMLDDDYVADWYHNDAFANWNRKAVERMMEKDPDFKAKYADQYDVNADRATQTAAADKIIMGEYRAAVKAADLITIDLGTNNFGTFLTGTIMDILGGDTDAMDNKLNFEQYVDAKTAASLDGIVQQMAYQLSGGTETGTGLTYLLAKCLMYGYLGFTEHYDGAIKAIYELNPNAKVVVIDMYTMITGIELDGSALGANLDLDEIYDMFIDMANFYTRELSPYASKVTHATLTTAPELCIDYFAQYEDNKKNGLYADTQYLHPIGYTLLNEFVMETALGLDPDEPADKKYFEENILSSILLLDGYVNDIEGTIETNVMTAVVDPMIKKQLDPISKQIETTITAINLIYTAVNGTKTAQENLPTAIEGYNTASEAVDTAVSGVATAEKAVDDAISGVATAEKAVNDAVSGVAAAEEAVDTAVSGVALASNIMDPLIENLIDGDFGWLFKGSSTNSSIANQIKDIIKDYITDDLMTQAGFEATDANRDKLADEAYYMACIYYDNGKNVNAYKLAVIEGMRFFLVETQGYTNDNANATAELAYELNTINTNQGRDAAVKKALMTQVDEATATQAMQLNSLVKSQGKEAAVIAAMSTVVDEDTAKLAYELNTINTNQGRDAAVKKALMTKVDSDTADKAIMLNNVVKTEGKKAAIVKAMATVVGDEKAALAYTMAKAYQDAKAAGKSTEDAEKAGVIAGIAGSLTDENMAALAGYGITDKNAAAELVYKVASMYNSTYAQAAGTDAKKKQAATVATLVAIAGVADMGIDEATATTGYQLYAGAYAPAIEAGKSEEEAKALTVIAAIKTEYPKPEGFAEALYAVYKDKTTATADQKELVYSTLMVKARYDQNIVSAICTCYVGEKGEDDKRVSLNGAYNNENVKTTMLFFMAQLKDGQGNALIADPSASYNQYLLYKNLPATLCKIANCKTIYFDALLSAAKSGLDDAMGNTSKKFMEGTLCLDKPAADASDEEWKAYKEDSALAILYFRFLAQDGVFTHPSHVGQQQLFAAAQSVLNSILIPEADSAINVTEDSNVLLLGDFVSSADEDSYVTALNENLGIEVTNLSQDQFRINEIRALLDDTYYKDAYAEEVLEGVEADAYKDAVKESDVVLLHVGSANMGFILSQLYKYYTTNGKETYHMEFSKIGSMSVQDLGGNVDDFLDTFTKKFSGNVDQTSLMMLAFESYGYGYTTFADCLDSTVASIKALNPDADIVLVGMYDLLGEAYVDKDGFHLEVGDFVAHAVELMNQHMEIYADMTKDVTYVDVSDIESNAMGYKNLLDLLNNSEEAALAYNAAMPTEKGYAEIASRLSCVLGGHDVDSDITWSWAEDCSTASVSFHCTRCGDAEMKAVITTEAEPSCKTEYIATHTASVFLDGKTYTDVKTQTMDPIDHFPEVIPAKAATCTQTGLTEGSKCSVCQTPLKAQETIPLAKHTEVTITGKAATCTKDGLTDGVKCGVCKDVLTAQKVIKATGHKEEKLPAVTATCTATGLTEGTKCSVCGDILKAQETVPMKDHSWDNGTVTKEPTEESSGIKTYTCSECKATKTETIPAKDHVCNFTTEVVKPTCTEKGYTIYTCKCGHTETKDEVAPLGHKFDGSTCTVCGYSRSDVTRIYGDSRYLTAYAVADELKEVMNVETFDTIIVAYGRGFADALAGSYLSTELNAPILLTEEKEDSEVLEYIEKNLTSGGNVYILGGTAVVSQAFEDGLKEMGVKYERLYGDTRYLTNLAILEKAGLNGKEILVCTGIDFADSLSASAANKPILLVNNVMGVLTDEQKAYLEKLEDCTFYIVGGNLAVSDELADQLAEYGKVERVYGDSREETSVKVAEAFYKDVDCAVLAYSRNFPDGLCGGLLAYKLNAPMLLVNSGKEAFAADYTEENSIYQGAVLGGNAVVTDDSIRTVYHMGEKDVIAEKKAIPAT